MFGSVILDVAIGLIIVYLLFSLVATTVREWFASILKTRATTLNEGLCELLGDGQLVADLYNHPIINSLYRGSTFEDAKKAKQLPSYMPAASFAAAMLDMVVRGRDLDTLSQSGSEARAVTIDNVRAQITRIGNPRVQRAVLTALDKANGDLTALYANIEEWFDSNMDRVSGWYKHHTQIYLFWIGFAIAVIADADSLSIARRLYTDPAQRQAAVAMAANIDSKDANTATVAQDAAAKLKALNLPLTGWTTVIKDTASVSDNVRAVLWHSWFALFGWLVTALAISMGAPFWFDALSKIMVVRNTLKPNSKPDPSAGHSPPPAPAVSLPSPPQAPSTAAIVAAPAPAPSSLPAYQPHEWAAGHANEGAA